MQDHTLSPRTASPLRDSGALAFAMLFPLFMAWIYFVVAASEAQKGNPVFIAAYGGAKLLQALFPLLYVGWFERDRLRLARPTTRGLLLGIGFAALVAAGMFALYLGWLRTSPLLADTPGRIFSRVREFGYDTPGGFLLIALYLSVAHSLFEEYYWRWFVFGTLKRHLSLAPAIAVSAAGFTLHHIVLLGVFFPGRFWSLALPFALFVGVGGAFWAWLYHRSGSLIAAWLSHALVDAAIMVVGYLMLTPFWA
jgi:membrane protease YdiL (CAAX protease family)